MLPSLVKYFLLGNGGVPGGPPPEDNDEVDAGGDFVGVYLVGDGDADE